MEAPNRQTTNVARRFVDTLECAPDEPAVERPSGRSVSRGELAEMIRVAARRLADEGVEAGDRVLLQVPPGPLFVAATSAANWLGAVSVLIAPSVGRATYRRMVEQVDPDHAWTHPIVEVANAPLVSGVLQRFGVEAPPVVLDWEERDVLVEADVERASSEKPRPAPPATRVDGETDASVVFSGGTGGVPKAARLGHRAIRRYVEHIGACLADMPRSERVLVDTPQQMICALMLGKTALPTPAVGRVEYILEAILEGRADTYFGSPSTWRRLRERAEPNPPTLPATFRTVLLGSAPVTGPMLRQLDDWLHDRAEVTCLYGTTEAGPICAARLEEKLAWEGAGNYVGEPIEGTSVAIEGDDSSEPGEVLVDSPSLFSGYVDEGGLDEAGDRPFATGDVGRWVDDGDALVLVGRRKDLIVSRGHNVYPYAAERALREGLDAAGDGRLERCALVGIDGPETADETLVLAVEAEGSVDEAYRQRLRSVLRRDAGRRSVPHHVFRFDSLPVTGRQEKLDRDAIRRRVRRRLDMSKEDRDA